MNANFLSTLLLSVLIMFSVSLFGCAAKQKVTAGTDASPSSANTMSYLIQPGDILQISVWKEKDMDRDVLVLPDGGLSFPLVGNIQAAGKTTDELRKEIESRLTRYIPGPVVTVAAKQTLGHKIYVVGKVNRPGEFITTRFVDVMQALGMAGGLTPYASANNIVILRRTNGAETSIPFKYGQVEDGRRLKQNIFLQSGDVVVVP